jgi:hypothetical protein
MQKRIPIAIAGALAACGAAAFALNNEADSKPGAAQKQSAEEKAVEASLRRARELNNATGQGGMAGCFDPSLSGYPRRMAEAAGGSPCDEEEAETDTGRVSGDAWAGKYEGDFDGGRGYVTIAAPDRKGAHRVELAVAGQGTGCSGEVSGSGVPRGDLLSLRIPNDDGSGDICSISLTRRGDGLEVQESGCAYHHGMSCGFSGSVTRRGQSAAASKIFTPSGAAPWIVGAWVPRGVACGGDGLVFQPDGVFMTVGEFGRWQLAGKALTFTVTHRGDMGEEQPVQNLQPSRWTVTASSARAFTMTDGAGSVSHMIRCR